MKLSKAKEILKDYLRGDEPDITSDLPDAIRLLIEAGSWMLLARVTTPGSVPTLLHGETED